MFVFAPSYAGKSYWCQKTYSSYGLRWVDADRIGASQRVWPEDKSWLEDPVRVRQVNERWWGHISRVLSRNVDLTVLGNVRLDVVKAHIEYLLRRPVKTDSDRSEFAREFQNAYGHVAVAVVPSFEELEKNYQTREEAIRAGVVGHTSRTREAVFQAVDQAQVEYTKAGLRIFESWKALQKAFGAYVSSGRI